MFETKWDSMLSFTIPTNELLLFDKNEIDINTAIFNRF